MSSASAGRLRLLPTPDREPGRGDPPVRSRLGLRALADQQPLPLTFVLPSGLTSEPQRPRLRLLRGLAEAGELGPQRTGRDELPNPGDWAPRFVQAVIDVVAGDRPPQQLLPWTNEDVYGLVRRRARHELQTVSQRRPSERRAAVRSVRVSEPNDGVAEGCATIRYRDRIRTIAFRLEGSDGRWRCTDLQFG